MTADSDPLSHLAAAVADGAPIDWPHEQSSVREPADVDAVEQLRILERIAAFHKSASGLASVPDAPSGAGRDLPAAPPAPPPASSGVPAFEWGPLKVFETLGSGSFGDVYRAWDTSLGRAVALKLLRARVPTSPDVEAIVNEGRLLARVRHPNVMAVYGAQAAGGRVGIWSEFLTGRTLAEIVQDDGPLSAQEAALFAENVCRALTAIHRAGLLHRDIKAQNVMREAGGRIVVMDFGLGRDLDAPLPEGGSELAGTPAYLAPELFTGARASAQTDVYAVGVLMFFLVTGQMPVSGRNMPEIAANHRAGKRRHLQDLRSDLPATFVQVVERALAGDAQSRFESAGAMQAAISGIGQAMSVDRKEEGRLGRATILAAVGVTALIAAAVILLASRVGERPATDPVFLELAPPPGTTLTEGARNVPAISPDGRHVAFVATSKEGVTQLWMRELGEPHARPIAGSENAGSPFWAPDSQWLAYFNNRGLQRVSLSGARSEVLSALWENRGGTWGKDGTLLFAPNPHSGLQRLTGSGAIEAVTEPDAARGEIGHFWPQFLPDGRRFLFFVLSIDERIRGVYLGTLDRSPPRRLLFTDASALYADGHLLYVRDGTLFAHPFNVDGGSLTGQPVPLVEQVNATEDYQSAVAVSKNGTLLFAPTHVRRLAWYNLQGFELGSIAEADKFRNPALSADGTRLAVQCYRDSVSEIRVFDLQRKSVRAIPHVDDAQFPVWGPGGVLALSGYGNGRQDVFKADPLSEQPPSLLFRSALNKMPTDWTRDGRVLAYTEFNDEGNYDVWLLSLDGTAAARPLVKTKANDASARFSPNGRLIAYVSKIGTDPAEVYVKDLRSSDPGRLVSRSGGYDPVWRSDTNLLYLNPGGTLMQVSVHDSRRLAVGEPVPLFKTPIDTPGTARNHYAFDAAGNRVLIAAPIDEARNRRFSALIGWPVLASRMRKGGQ